MKLDNFNDKLDTFKLRAGSQVEETLYPNSVPTFVPPRPVEGVIARHLAGLLPFINVKRYCPYVVLTKIQNKLQTN